MSSRGLTYLGAEEGTGAVHKLAADDHNLLSSEDLLGDDGCKSSEEVTLSIDDLLA